MNWNWLAALGVCLAVGIANADDKATDTKKGDEPAKTEAKEKGAKDDKKADAPEAGAKKDETKKAEGAAESPLKTVREKASYGIGLNIGRSLQRDGIEVDAKLVAQGIADVLADKTPLISQEELIEAFTAFREEIAAKQEAAEKAAADKNIKEGQEFLDKNKKREGVKTTDSGLQYEVLKDGEGKTSPKATDTVRVHYHGTLIDGTVFDSSVNRGEPLELQLNGVIKGWTEALQLMQVGDKYKLFLPSELAYGKRGDPPKIGPNSVLIFEVELLEIQ